MLLSDSVLIESKSARDNQLERVTHDRASDVLDTVKGLYFALWQGVGAATTQHMKEFYVVDTDAVESALRRHRDEFESDGLKTLKGKLLKDFLYASAHLTEASKISQLVVWTPRAALRLGMVLKDSAVAKAVRTTLLDAVEQVIPAQATEIERLKLELALAQAQTEAAREQRLLGQFNQAVLQIHGAGMMALILGKPDAVVEPPPTIVEKTVLVNPSGKPIATYQGLSKTKLAKRYGMKKAADFVTWLNSIGKADLLHPGMTATPCEFVPWEFVKELDRAWSERQGSRQRLLGE